jgi:hypothetical protein
MTNVNPNTHFPHGDDPSVSDATGSVVITEAEKEKENKTPRTEMVNSDIHISQGVDALYSDVTAPVVNQAGEEAFQPQAKTNAPAKVGRNEPCPCGSGKKFKKCCGLGQERMGMTHEFLVIYDRKRRITGHLLPEPIPSVQWIRNQAIDFGTRFPDFSGVMVLKVKYNLDTRNVLHVWAFDPATGTWLDTNDASAIRWAQNLFNANQQEVLRQVLNASPHPVAAVLDGTPEQQMIVDFVVLCRGGSMFRARNRTAHRCRSSGTMECKCRFHLPAPEPATSSLYSARAVSQRTPPV